MPDEDLQESPFYEFLNRGTHFSQGKLDEDLIDWNGYALPMHQGDPALEYNAIRHEAALFDVSPMRKTRITGADAAALLDVISTRKISSLPNQQAAYTVLCNNDGTLKDDAMVYRFAEDDFLLLPSDIDHRPYFETIAGKHNLTQLRFADTTHEVAGIALQGPCSAAIAVAMGFRDAVNLSPYEFQTMNSEAGEVLVARMGFTADLGFEFWLTSPQAGSFVELIKSARESLNLNIPGYGLSALEACRIEGGFIVAGWDFSTEIDPQPGFERTPYDVGLGWLVEFDDRDFVGRSALETIKGKSEFLIRRFSTNELATAPSSLDGVEVHAEVDGKTLSIGTINCSAWTWGDLGLVGNVCVLREYRDVASAWFNYEGGIINIALSKGALINPAWRNAVPAPIYSTGR